MGRTVEVHPRAAQVVYIHLDALQEVYSDPDATADEAEFLWDEFRYGVQAAIRNRFPSMEPVKDRWEGRESRVILENRMAFVTLSGYGGVASVCLVPKMGDLQYSDEPSMRELRKGWCDRVSLRGCFSGWRGMLVKMGTFSNGEAVYRPLV